MKLIQKIFKLSNFIILIFLVGCAAIPGGDARKNPPDPKERVKKNKEEGRGFRLMDVANKGGTNFEFASSNELWRASLDIIDFMPLTTANYSGGIIVTDWYSDNQNSNESIKITIRFLSNEIRSDAIELIVFNKKCDVSNRCAINEGKDVLKKELTIAILKKAATYKAQADN